MLDKVRHPTVQRVALVTYVTCLVSLIFVYFVISGMAVPYSVYMQGPATLEAGTPNAIRGMLMDAMNGQTVYRVESAKLSLEDEDGETILEKSITPGAGGLIHTQLEPAADTPPGEYQLVIDSKIILDEPRFKSRAPVRIKAPEVPHPKVWHEQKKRMPAQELERTRLGLIDGSGPVRIDIIPREPILVRGLPGEVFLRTTVRDTGEPISCSLRLAEKKGLLESGSLPDAVKTDAFGLAKIRFAPTTTHHWVLASDCLPEGHALAKEEIPQGDDIEEIEDVVVVNKGEVQAINKSRVQIGTAPAQLALVAQHPWVHPGRDAVVATHSLFRDGSVLVDLYRGDRWVWAGSFGLDKHRGGGLISVPPVRDGNDGPDVYSAKVFSDIYVQGNAWDAVNLIGLETDGEEHVREALLALAKKHSEQPGADPERNRYMQWLAGSPDLLTTASGKQQKALLEMLLLEIPVHRQAPAVVLNSLDRDQKELAAWKNGIRDQLLGAIALAILIGLALLIMVVMWGIQQAQYKQRLLHEVELELAEQDLSDIEDGFVSEAEILREGKLARAMAIFQGVIVVGTLILFAASILLILRFMM